MDDCKYLKIEDITPWHSDIFDHPNYECTCTLTGRKVITCIICNEKRCKKYEPLERKEN